MEQQVLITNPSNLRLQPYLPADLFERLVRDGSLPPYMSIQECKRLRRELSAIASFLPYPLIQSRLAHSEATLEGMLWHGSLLVADIDGLITIVERLSVLGQQAAPDVAGMISLVYDGLVEDIHTYSGGLLGGGLLAFYGTTMVAFFNAEILGAGHALHATSAALAMQARLAAYARLETSVGDIQLGLRVGIHSGRFFAAILGEAEALQLVLSSAETAPALRAQELARPGDVVLSAAALSLLRHASATDLGAGFYLLQYVPKLPAPRTANYWGWESGAGNLAELRSLASRIEALRPCLPRGLPPVLSNADLDPAGGGDFRSVTVLSTLVAYGDLLALAGEDTMLAARLLNSYFRRVQATIHRYGGTVLRAGLDPRGDLVIALFGAPEPCEDSHLRAVRAALDLRFCLSETQEEINSLLRIADCRLQIADPSQSAICNLQSTILTQQIGISTGTIFAGVIGGARRREYVAIGAVVDQAAQLAAAARSGEIWVSAVTRRLVERYVTVYEAPAGGMAHTAAAIGRFYHPGLHTPLDPASRPPLVGRDAEVRLLLGRAIAAEAGQGQVVALIGDAGSGKTRLIEELRYHLAFRVTPELRHMRPFSVYAVECQSYEQRTPYAVLRDLLRQLLRIPARADDGQVYETVARRLREQAGEVARFVPILGDLLDLPVEETVLTASLSLEQRHERVYDLIEALLRIEVRREPVLLVVDDVHWADASSVEVLARLAEATPGMQLLLLLSYRPRMLDAEPWRASEACSAIALHDLSPEQATAMVATLLGEAPPPELNGLLEQAQGNPFFIEELIWNLMDQGLLHRGSVGWRIHMPADVVTFSARVERVITARLDRLDAADRAVAEAAAVIGRRFSRSLLAAILDDTRDLNRHLEILERTGLIRPGASGYIFRHTLLRDVTYNGIPYEDRAALHRRIAAQLANTPEANLDLLARHTLLAEDWEATFGYHLAAGRQARARHANQEAIALFETALAIVGRLDPQPREELVELYERLGYLYALISRHEEALDSFDKALTLCKRGVGSEGSEGLVRIHRQIASVHERQSDYDAASEWLERALSLAGNEPGLELTRCLLLRAGISYRQGSYGQAIAWATRGLEMAEQIHSHRELAHAHKLLAAIHGNLGDGKRAVELARRSLELYTSLKDLQGQAGAHINLGIFFHDLGLWSQARDHFEAGAQLSAAIGNIHEQAAAANNLGDVLRRLGDIDEAIEQYQVAQRGLQHSPFGNGVVAMNLGASYLQRGDLTLAEQQFVRSEELFAQAGSEGFLPELLRYRAEMALVRGDIDTALAACEESLQHAVRLGARLEEGTTRRVLGQVLVARGDLMSAAQSLEASLEALREANGSYEIGCTLLEIADLVPLIHQADMGTQAFAEAWTILQSLGAQLEIERARRVAQRWGYATPL